MSQPALEWRLLSTLGRWVVKGPRSLVSCSIPTGGAEGWLDRMMHWQRSPISGGLHESCTVFRRFEFEGAALPPFVVRFACWNAARDRAACNERLATQLTLKVTHFEFSSAAVTRVLMRERDLLECLTESQVPVERSDSATNTATMAYCWDYPGRLVRQELSWLSGARTANLEQLWQEVLPTSDGLQPLQRFIERFEMESFNEYIDASVSQLPVIHRLIEAPVS